MLITNFRGLLALVLAAVLLAGCATTREEEPPPEEPEPTVQPTQPVEPERPEPQVRRDGEKPVLVWVDEQGRTEELQGVFYFDFDQAIVKREAYEELRKHADFLAENPSERVRLEGHADERGTREYNLALGERRANAVRAYLMTHGASASQLETISYGEEKPVVDGSNERAWAQNRRVELVYK